MILSNISDKTEQYQLLEEIDMDVYRDDMEEIAYSLYCDKLNEKKKELAENKKELAEIKKEIAEKDKEIAKLKTTFAKAIEVINARKDIPPKTKMRLTSILL